MVYTPSENKGILGDHGIVRLNPVSGKVVSCTFILIITWCTILGEEPHPAWNSDTRVPTHDFDELFQMEQGEEKISRNPPRERYHGGMHWGVGGGGEGTVETWMEGREKGGSVRERGANKKNEMKEGKQRFMQKWNKRSVLRRQCWDTNQNVERLVFYPDGF